MGRQIEGFYGTSISVMLLSFFDENFSENLLIYFADFIIYKQYVLIAVELYTVVHCCMLYWLKLIMVYRVGQKTTHLLFLNRLCCTVRP